MNAVAGLAGAAALSTPWSGWHWLPDRTSWFEQVRQKALAWVPPAGLVSEPGRVRACLVQAAEQRAAWLVHPCTAALLTEPRPDTARAAHARLAVWAAVHAPAGAALGALSLAQSTWVWLADGPALWPSGAQTLAGLQPPVSAPVADAACPDPWGDCLADTALAGDMAPLGWWARLPLSDDDERRLADDLRRLIGLQRLLAHTVPDAGRWVGSVTRVVVPLASPDAPEFRSGSIAGVPGLVFVEMTRRPLLVLEALVHESAHLHFHLAELGVGFIAAGHDGLYASPLRRDPRPLRGIYLAFHALLYMCAFYKDWATRDGDGRADEARQALVAQRDAARRVLLDARAHLSPAGDAFLQTCLEAADADDAR